MTRDGIERRRQRVERFENENEFDVRDRGGEGREEEKGEGVEEGKKQTKDLERDRKIPGRMLMRRLLSSSGKGGIDDTHWFARARRSVFK